MTSSHDTGPPASTPASASEHDLPIAALREHLSPFISRMPMLVAMLDRQMRYLAWSELWPAHYQLPTRDLLGKCHHDLFPDLPDARREAFRRAFAGENPGWDHERIERADGTVIWGRLAITPIPDRSGDIVAIALFVEDITRRKQAEQALRAGEQRLRLATEASGIGLFERDFATGVISVPEDYADMRDLIPDAAPPSPARWRAILEPDDRERFEQARMAALDPAGDGRIAVEVAPLIDGRRRPTQILGQVRFDAARTRPASIMGVLVDQTEAALMRDALSQSQRLETVGRLAGVIAHDFNNLLTVILSSLELAGRQAPSPGILGHLERAIEAAEMGAGFNKRLLALAGGQQAPPGVFPLDSHIAKAWQIIERLLSEKLRIRFIPGASAGFVRLDPGELDGALLNLVANARDASPDGGEIRVRTGGAVLSAAEAAAIPEGRPGDFLWLEVADSGIGMAPGVASQAMEPFFTTKDSGKGTGLGLTSVATTTVRAGGFVQIVSAPGAGTTVRLFLPRVAAEPAADMPGDDEDEMPLGDGELILVVEDDPLVRETALLRLEALGYAVIEAGDAETAQSLLTAGEPVDLVFSDVVLAGEMTGHDLAAVVRRDHPGMGILLTSGHLSREPVRSTVTARDVELLRKPYLLRALAQAVARALARRSRPT